MSSSLSSSSTVGSSILAGGGSDPHRTVHFDPPGGWQDRNRTAEAQRGNLSCAEPYLPYAFESTVLLGFVTPFVLLFGLTANAFNLRIFTHKFMRSSLLNWYLAVLSLSDAAILLTAFFFICLPRLAEYFDDFSVVNFCNRIAPFNYAAGLTAQTASVWLTVLMSTHRFIGVCLPFKTQGICTKTNCKLALTGVLLFALIFNATRYFEVSTTTCYSPEVNFTLIVPMTTSIRQSEVYQMVYVVWFYFIVMFCLPFMLLITLNTLVILAIRRTSRLHYQVTMAATATGNNFNDRASVFRKRGEMSKEISTSIMLVGVVVVFLICNTMALVVNILELIDSYYGEKEKNFVNSDLFHQMVDLSNVLVLVNASINIFVYLSFSEKFRLLLKHYLSCACFNNSEPLVDWTNS